MNSYERLEETILPTKANFYNYLRDENVSDDAYDHVQTVWTLLKDTFGRDRNLGSLATLYLSLDTLLLGKRARNEVCPSVSLSIGLSAAYVFITKTHPSLEWPCFLLTLTPFFPADVFQEFRRLTMSSYQLEALRYVTLPSLALQAALKWTKIELQLITDPNLYLYFESYSRGGLVFVANRYAESNLPGMPNYISTEPQRLILYLDQNNLYGHR